MTWFPTVVAPASFDCLVVLSLFSLISLILAAPEASPSVTPTIAAALATAPALSATHQGRRVGGPCLIVIIVLLQLQFPCKKLGKARGEGQGVRLSVLSRSVTVTSYTLGRPASNCCKNWCEVYVLPPDRYSFHSFWARLQYCSMLSCCSFMR